MPTYEWTSKRNGQTISKKLPSFEVTSHPLKIINIKSESSKSFMENLIKWSSTLEEVDPLLRFEQLEQDEDITIDKLDNAVDYRKAWSSRRATILNKYTTGEKLTIVSSYLPGGEKALIRQVSNLNEKVKHRLEQLDDFDEGSVRKTIGLSQQEFVGKINVLSEEIKKAWSSEQRVRAFKIAIQCSKLLSDVSVIQFYPSKFALITEILETFGNLVFQRLHEKSFGPKCLNVDVDSKNVPETAKETCQNWMFKMASIRELLPRLYMEMALLRCYLFISKDEIKPAIERLTLMIRGIGNPLVAIYLRYYLCRVASNLLGKDSEEYFYSNLKEFQEEYPQIFHPMILKKQDVQLLTMDKYLNLYVPAVDWLLYGTLNSNICKQTLLNDLLDQCEKIENNELLLSCIVSAFDSPSIVKKAAEILNMIQISSVKKVLLHEILHGLGSHLCAAGGAGGRATAEALAHAWWTTALSLPNATHFLRVLEPWIEFACAHLTIKHVDVILRVTITYMNSVKSDEDFSSNIQPVLKRMLNAIPEVEDIFFMDAFMPMLEQSWSGRPLAARAVLTAFLERRQQGAGGHVRDPLVIAGLARLCRVLHDSVSAVTVEDEIKVVADIITKFVQAVSYGDDYEQQLNFYVECRASFIKLDAVLKALVYAVNALSTRADSARGRWLSRACAAFCFVTVPSLTGAPARAQMYLATGQAALLNGCVGQAEANFKALIGLLPEIPDYIVEDGQKKPTSTKVMGILSDFLSTLLILPDNVDSNCKAYVLSGLIKTMERIHWRKCDPLYYTTLLHILDLLCAMTQENYAYHIDVGKQGRDPVLSNDKLYGSDEEFISAIDTHATNICQELLVVLKAMGDENEHKKQCHLALELFWRVITKADLKRGPMASLAANLWLLSQKHLDSSTNKLAREMLQALERNDDPVNLNILQKLRENTKSG